MTTDDFREKILPSIPTDPGVYQYRDEAGNILYVGKAKNLRNRLSSYFGDKKHQSFKTRVMVNHAARIEFTIVETEHDALLLENTLIKKFQPPYNVMLKDAKGYTYLCVKKERFPRVFITRRVWKDGSTYFGPYTSKQRIEVILELIKKLFQLRTCNLVLSKENVERGKFKVCLEYHIKNCAGPCCNHETEEAYLLKVEQIKHILRGHFGEVKTYLRSEMQRYAGRMEFEKAQTEKEKLAAFEDYQGKSTVVNPAIRDVDVFSIATDEKMAYVNYLKVINGAIINTHTQEMTKNLDEDPADLLAFAVGELREKFNSIAPEVLAPFRVALLDESIKMTVPKIGDKKSLLDLSEKNVKYYLLQKQKDEAGRIKKETNEERVMATLQKDLRMAELPRHIECFDNSNLLGTNPVSSCVVFLEARPAKREYRHYNVKTVEGPNDFATMEEVVYRRYKRLLAEAASLPQLVIIDGGKGQLAAAMKSLEALGLVGKMTVVGIAKRLEEIFFPGDSLPLYIDKKSESLRLIQQARNEAHRFGITFHRNQRSKNFLGTELTDIGGIGDKTAEKLLSHFGSVKRIKEAAKTEVAAVVEKPPPKKVAAYFASSPEPAEP